MIEIWLTKKNLGVRCMIVQEDETTETMMLQKTNIRGAMRFVTSTIKTPVGRWRKESENEYSRIFR